MTEWIITSCVLILVVIILRTVLKGKISLRLQYALWALVLVRLLIPGSLFSSAVSVMNAVGERPSVPTEITVADPPGRWEYPGVELAPTITQTVDEQGNVHYTEDLEKWEQDKEAAWQEYKEEHTEYLPDGVHPSNGNNIPSTKGAQYIGTVYAEYVQEIIDSLK